jgi:hypothetical protein
VEIEFARQLVPFAPEYRVEGLQQLHQDGHGLSTAAIAGLAQAESMKPPAQEKINFFDLLRATAKNGKGYLNEPLLDKLEASLRQRRQPDAG